MNTNVYFATICLLTHSLAAADLVRVNGGTFEVPDAITTVRVRVSVSDFLLAATEVTQAEYMAVTGKNPSLYKGPNRPVENVSWLDAVRYCNLRSVKEKLQPCYEPATGKRKARCDGYRLPTEAEWVQAAGAVPGPKELKKFARLGDSSTKSISVLEKDLAAGTSPAKSFEPNAAGIFDIRGNVWEWCEDYFDVLTSPDATRNPRGPASGLARVIRGGSFVSSTSRWSRDYRSSMNADARSRYTGFRVARSLNPSASETFDSDRFFRRYNQAPAGFETSIGSLTSLATKDSSIQDWKTQASSLRSKWEVLLAAPKPAAGIPASRLIRTVQGRNATGSIQELEMEPGGWEKICVLRPARPARGRLPVLIVPFYDIDTPVAMDLGGRNYAADRGINAFAWTAAQHGYLAIAVRWFGESYGESYSEAVANLALRHPGATGLGKWLTDSRRLLDYIATLPDADPSRIGIMGHSLGGKMALYAAAFDDRIRAVVSSEPGIGFRFSNYEDYWYLGDKLAGAPPGTDQHELIGLIAPRPFLLIGGDEYDRSESWGYINAVRPVYGLFGKPDNVGYFNHHTGHTPSPESVSLAFEWLDHFLAP